MKLAITNPMGGAPLLLTQLGRRLEFANVVALTRAAVAVKAAEVDAMRAAFDRPTPYTLGGVYVLPATRQQPTATVGLKDSAAVGRQGTPASKFLAAEIDGGERRLKRFERLLQERRLMPRGWYAVPGRAATLDAFGNWSRGQLIQVLSQLQITPLSGYTRNMPRLFGGEGKREKQAVLNKRRRAMGRAGGQFVAIPSKRGKLQPGIYLAEGKDFGARLGYGRNGRLSPVLVFFPSAVYAPRLGWHQIGERVAGVAYEAELEQAVRQFGGATA